MSESFDPLRSLARMARVLGSLGGVQATVEAAAEEARAALGAASVSVSRLEPGTDAVRVLINVGDLGPDEVRLPTDEIYRLSDFQLMLQMVQQERSWFTKLDDPDLDPAERRALTSLGKGSALGAPVLVDGIVWGELYATRHVGAKSFADGDRSYIEALAAIMGAALGRDLAIEALSGLAFRDPLTGLYNRRALDDAGERALTEHRLRGTDVVLVVIDVDGLKRVNDRQGHSEGDRLLIYVATFLTESFSPLPGAMAARVGGDEFCLLVTGRPMPAVLAIAEHMCRTPLHGDTGLSCGVAQAENTAQNTFQALYVAADSAQCLAKRTGGRHVRTAPSLAS